MRLFGLVGKSLLHSFSKEYFTKKFENENINNCSYNLFELENIEQIKSLIENNKNILGLNITIPYKEQIIQFLDEIDNTAKTINSVNTIKIENKNLHGFNTDYIGFEKSFSKKLKHIHTKAIIFGTGGSSKSVSYVLKKLNIDFIFVSREKNNNCLTYSELNKDIISEHKILINTTPVGMFPKINETLNISIESISSNHYFFDLIYNPNISSFLKLGLEKNAIISNGLEMLEIQAEESWKIWNNKLK